MHVDIVQTVERIEYDQTDLEKALVESLEAKRLILCPSDPINLISPIEVVLYREVPIPIDGVIIYQRQINKELPTENPVELVEAVLRDPTKYEERLHITNNNYDCEGINLVFEQGRLCQFYVDEVGERGKREIPEILMKSLGVNSEDELEAKCNTPQNIKKVIGALIDYLIDTPIEFNR